jgi:hypothetical protein
MVVSCFFLLSLKPQLNVIAGVSGRDGRREARTWQAHASKDERQGRAPGQMRQQPRCAVTLLVNGSEGTKSVFMRPARSGKTVNWGFKDDAAG